MEPTNEKRRAQRILIVVPTYDERENLPRLVAAVRSQLPQADILVVDDASPDGTGRVADALAAADPAVRVLHRPAKQGLGTAYIAGFRVALAGDYEYIFEMDCDFSHDPKYLPAMLALAQSGADLVLGSRYVEGGGTLNWGFARKCISRGGSLYARTILGIGVRDLTGGFKCFRRRVLETIDLSSIGARGYGFQIEMTYRTLLHGYCVREMPIVFVDRRVGQSKMSKAIFLEAVSTVWKLRRNGDRLMTAPQGGKQRVVREPPAAVVLSAVDEHWVARGVTRGNSDSVAGR